MINDAGSLLEKLNSPSDWAFVLGAGTLGLVLDGALNVVPLPFFSPGICALTAASATLSVKRGLEAAWAERIKGRKARILHREAEKCISELRDREEELAAEELNLDVALAGSDLQALEMIVRDARYRRRYAAQNFAFQGTLAQRFYGGGEAVEQGR